MVFKLADTNNDGQISQKEAVDAGNLLVGGFFFRADTNGDGVLTRAGSPAGARDAVRSAAIAEVRLAESQADNWQPGSKPSRCKLARPTILRRVGAEPGRGSGADDRNLLDSNHDQKIEATELRQAVQTGVQTLFTVADTNQDGQLSPYELNAAVGEVAKSAVQNVFQAADADRNGC